VKILALSDVELPQIYSPQIKNRFKDVDLIISCGDLPPYYLEYVVSNLDKPLYFVFGNHASREESSSSDRIGPWVGSDIHRRIIKTESGLWLAGIEGSIRYNYGEHQYSQSDMWLNVFDLVPRLLFNRALHGRYLDVFVTHSPPWKIHDKEDLPHHGIKAFRWFNRVFKPLYHLHGHVHIYRQDEVCETIFYQTQVVNTYGYKVITLPG
jgi:uncharacterized protein